jgi:hypothetical protein
MVGRKVTIINRPYLLYDCDKFTRKCLYLLFFMVLFMFLIFEDYTDIFGITNFPTVQLPVTKKIIPVPDIRFDYFSMYFYLLILVF